MSQKYLNLGCGSHFHPSWVNVNFTSTAEGVIAHDLRTGIPFGNEEFDVVYHSHILEHFSKEEAPFFLQECFRVLKPHGVLRVAVPDLEQIARIYLEALEKAFDGSEEWKQHYDWILLELYDQVVRNQSGGAMATYLAQSVIPNEDFVIQRIGQEAKTLIKVLRSQRRPQTKKTPSERDKLLLDLLGSQDYHALQIGRFRQKGEIHQWMYDRYSLRVLLEFVGFQDIFVCQHNESRIPGFESFGLDSQIDGTARKPDSLFVEAVKPDNLTDPNELWGELYGEGEVSMVNPTLLSHQPPKTLDELPHVQSLHSKIRAQQSHIEHLEATLAQLEEKLGKVRKRAKRFKQEVGQLKQQQQHFETSVFRQLRCQWLTLKNWFGQK